MRFVLLDQIVQLRPGHLITARKVFRPEEEFFADHFPSWPIVPGVLVTETMVQAGGWLIVHHLNFSKWPLLCMIDKAKFRRFVRPGEELVVTARIETLGEVDYEVKAAVNTRQRRVAEAQLFYHGFSIETAVGPDGNFDSAPFSTWAINTFRALDGFAAAGLKSGEHAKSELD